MKLGYFDFNPDYSIRPDDLARACEERGYDSLWLGEHINIPVSRRTPYPLGGELPKILFAHARSFYLPDGRQRGYEKSQACHRHLSDD